MPLPPVFVTGRDVFAMEGDGRYLARSTAFRAVESLPRIRSARRSRPFGSGARSRNNASARCSEAVMKLIHSFLCSTLLFARAFSQLVVTVPQYATENDSIVIRFDATQTSASELLNYGGIL